MPEQHTVNGWPDYRELFDVSPYTIVIGQGARARKSLREFACDGDAIRWAGTRLGDQHEWVRVYRGRRPRGKPLMEIRAPKR
jgi:hypothetical protein